MRKVLRGDADASAVFAPPVSQDGTTVIPVAEAVWGFSGGAGSRGRTPGKRTRHPDSGGAVISPKGYLVLRNGEVSYHPIRHGDELIVAAGVGAGLALLAAYLLGGPARWR